MMRFSQLTWVGLGVLLVLPAFSRQDHAGRRAGLESAIRETVDVLGELGGLQQSLQQGDTRSVGRLRELTESPILDAPTRDRMLAELRVAVSALQMQVDTGGQDGSRATPWEPGRTPGTTPLNLGALGRVPTGEIAGASEALTPGELPRAGGAARTNAKANGVRPPAGGAVSREPVGYSADPLRQARLAILADRPADALTLLENAGEASEIVYWRARAFEELGQIEAAIEAYRKVAEDQFATELATRAAQDLAFLEWKRDLDARRASREARRAPNASSKVEPREIRKEERE